MKQVISFVVTALLFVSCSKGTKDIEAVNIINPIRDGIITSVNEDNKNTLIEIQKKDLTAETIVISGINSKLLSRFKNKRINVEKNYRPSGPFYFIGIFDNNDLIYCVGIDIPSSVIALPGYSITPNKKCETVFDRISVDVKVTGSGYNSYIMKPGDSIKVDNSGSKWNFILFSAFVPGESISKNGESSGLILDYVLENTEYSF